VIANQLLFASEPEGVKARAFGGKATGLFPQERLSSQTQAELMIAEDRERMIELCRRIAMETDSKRLALWIEAD
jgi:hypothetical protein